MAALDVAGATAAIAAREPTAPFAFVATINAQILLLAEDPASGLRQAHDAAWLRVNDSQVLARLHRWALGEQVPVAAGSDVCMALLRMLGPEDAITLIGGGPDVAARLRERFGLRRIAQHEPPMGYMDNPASREAAIRFVLDHPARFVFVATGAPRSEQLLLAVLRRGGAQGLGLPIGSGLLFAAGLTPRAPPWMRHNGLEWLHRTTTEPKRLGRRYVTDLPHLLRMALRARRQGRNG